MINPKEQRIAAAFDLRAKYQKLERIVDPSEIGIAQWGTHYSRRSTFLLVAPHSVRHWRNAAVKGGEPGTWPLAHALAVTFNQDCIWLQSDGAEVTWNNREDDLIHRLDAAALEGKFIIDLHGMSDKHGVDICIGTGVGTGSLGFKVLESALAANIEKEKIGWNIPFAATAEHTVTSYVQRAGYDRVIQLELAPVHRAAGLSSTRPDIIDLFANLL